MWPEGGSKPADTSKCLSAERYTEMDCDFRPCWAKKLVNRQVECSERGKGGSLYCKQKVR